MKFGSVLNIRPPNAILAWLLLGALAASVAETLLEGELLWAGFGVVTIAVALVPPILAMDRTVMVSWNVLLLSALPAFTHVLDVFSPLVGYVSVAALGLLVVAEIDQFSTARLPNWFAATLVVMATMTVASLWVSVRFFANRWLDTSFVTSVDALMWGLVAASAVGIGFGVLFELGIREREVV